MSSEQKKNSDQLNDIFSTAIEADNYRFFDTIVRDMAYGTAYQNPNPVQALVMLKAKARALGEDDPRFDDTLLFMAHIIANEDVNSENDALIRSLQSQDSGEDLLKYIADGDFDGFDDLKPVMQTRLIANAKQVVKILDARDTPSSGPVND